MSFKEEKIENNKDNEGIMKAALNGMYKEELEELMKEIGQAPYRGRQLFHYFHKERGRNIMEAGLLPLSLRRELDLYKLNQAKIIEKLVSKDGSRKYLMEMDLGGLVETVYMPYKDRTSICISSQISCRMGCAFCASGKLAFVRNLRAEEMLEQIYLAEADNTSPIDHLVIMGIGEGLDNFDQLIRFLRLITCPEGKNLSYRHITLSTCGLVPKIYDLAKEGLPINLAISLHATTDERRQRTMPIAKKYSIDQIIEAALYYFSKTGRQISFEYALIKGENDRQEDVKILAEKFARKEFHINLIPLNKIDEFDGLSGKREDIDAFARKLKERGVHVTIRQKRGSDIDAACGQLRASYKK